MNPPDPSAQERVRIILFDDRGRVLRLNGLLHLGATDPGRLVRSSGPEPVDKAARWE
ncbi:MAG: hypothetical protein ACRDU8_01145 [Egibacteraceae bacterium]